MKNLILEEEKGFTEEVLQVLTQKEKLV